MCYLKACTRTAIALLLLSSAASAQRPFEVKWAGERLTVKASAAPLADVVGEVGKLANIEVIGLDKLAGPLSVDIANQEIEKALGTILDGVNYSLGKRPNPDGTGAPKLVLRVLSMARAGSGPVNITGPLHVPALDLLVAEALTDAEDEKEADADDDPDYEAEVREEKDEAAKLAAEGAFGPKADVAALTKLMDNYNDYIRVEALKALATRPMPQALAPLSKALGDAFWDVRTVAVEALARARDAESLTMVGQLLIKHSDDLDIRVDALRVLAQRAQPESMPFLKAYMKTAARDDEERVHEAVQQMITEFEWRAAAAKANPR